MNVLLQKHGAKHTFKVPEGLRELCTDIAREVLRSQPRNIYCFIADYMEALLITRENAKVAVKVVNNILLGSQAIVCILYRSGLSSEQIVRAAPKIQKAFGAYLDAVDTRAAQMYDDATCACEEEESKVSLQSILQATGVSLEQADRAATIIQAAFRGHYQRMLLNESQGVIPWQRAATRTLEILKKAGASQAEASNAAVIIQATYRGYYTRRLLKMKTKPQDKEDEVDTTAEPQEEEESEVDVTESMQTIQSIAWLDMIYEESGPTLTRANEAAIVIQRAYRRYRKRTETYSVSWLESTKPMVVGAIVKNLHRKVLDQVVARVSISAEFDSRQELLEAGEELQRIYEDRLTRACITEEHGYDEKELTRPEKSDESVPKLAEDDIAAAVAAAGDREEGREIEAAPGRDGETDAGLLA